MPGGSLPGVSQSFGADASGYLAEVGKVIAANRELVASTREVQRALGEIAALRGQSSGGSGQDVAAEFRRQMDAVRSYGRALGEAKDATGGFTVAQAAGLAVARDHAAAMAAATRAAGDYAAAQAATRTASDAITASLADQARAQATANDAAMVLIREHLAGNAVLRDSSTAVRSYGTDLGDLGARADSAAASLRSTAAATAELAAANAVAANAASGGGWAGGTTSAATAAIIARNIVNSGRTTSNTGDPAVMAALGALLGSSGSGSPGGTGSGGGGGFWGGFLGAARPSNIFGGALDTVKMAHMITMFAMESLSTILPAAVAAGAAGATGLQGGVNLYTAGTGLYNATEALGGAYGKTFGSYLGLGSSFQAAQNMANGGVYGITGGVLNLAGQGRDAFSGMGVQAIAMIDRGIASMVLNNRMSQVAGALSGGVGDLQSFGDVAANLGDTLLNMAPSLPGLGPDLLGLLKGGTGALASTTGFLGKTGLLGPLLAGEAGYRWGGLVLSGGKMPWFLGGKTVGGLSGLAERMGLGTTAAEGLTAEDIASAGGMGIDLTGLGGAGAAEGTGLAGLLAGGAAGLPVGALAAIAALSAYGISKGSFGTLAGRQMGGYLGGINQSFGVNAWQPIGKALYQAAAVQQNLPGLGTETVAGQKVTTGVPIAELMREGYTRPEAVAKYAAEFAANTKALGDMQANLIEAGPQAVKALQDMGIKGASVAQALGVMTEAMVGQSMIGAGGKLSPKAVQMMRQFETTYAPMTGTGAGAIMAGASAQDIMSYSGMKSLQTLNSAMDSVSQIIMGGASGAAASYGAGQGLAGAVTPKKGQSAAAAIAQALGASPFTAQGAAAWSAFTTGTANAPGAISTLESEGDQLRTYLTLGALSSGQAGQLGAYEARQFLPDVKGSPMAMAMLAQQAVASGVPGAGYYNSRLSPAQNYANLQKALTQHGISGQRAAGLLAQGTIKTADLPSLAASLITSQSGASALDTAEVTQAVQQALAVQQAVATGKPPGGSLSGLVATLMAGGAKSSGAVGAGLASILGQEGIGGKTLSGLVQHGEVLYKAEYERANPPKPPAPQTYDITPRVHAPVIPPAAPQTYQVIPHVHMPTIPKVPDQSFNIVGHVFIVGGGVAGGAGAVAASTIAGTGGGMRFTGGQRGFRVPGYGGGDTHPALLEGGEAVVPKHLVPAVAPFLSAHGVPGFQAGGIAGGGLSFGDFLWGMTEMEQLLLKAISAIPSGSPGGTWDGGGGFGASRLALLPGSSPAAPKGTPASPVSVSVVSAGGTGGGEPAGAMGALPIPAAAQKVVDAFEKTFKGMGNPWGGFASEIMQGLLDSIKDASKETSAEAKALTAKVTQEVTYARNVASAAAQGQGYGSAGLLGTFGNLATPVTTGTGQPYQYYADQANAAAGGTLSVQQQMSDYLQAEKSFTADLGKLSKGGLSKALQQQLLAAGPLQGDELAQSILGGAGGIGGANSLWKQIGAASNALGIQGAEGVYGYGGVGAGKSVQVKATAEGEASVRSLQNAINAVHGKTVTIDVRVTTGGGAGGGGGVSLSNAQIKTLVEQVETKLLEQAKRNRKTGLTLPGYGS